MSGKEVKWTKVEFDGTAKNFPKYEIQLKAALGMEGMTRALDPAFENELPSLEAAVLVETDASDKKKMEARKMNAKVVNMIVLGQKSTTMINMIESTKTDEWPTGLAHEIWAEFKARFAPNDDIAEMDMEEDLAKIRIGAKEDPWNVNDKIGAVQVKYGCTINEKRKAAIIIRAGKMHYASVLTSTSQLVRQLHSRQATSRELMNEMRAQWRIESKTNGNNEDDVPTEAALADTPVKKKFQGKCYICGEKGHRAAECPKANSGDKDTNKKKKFNGNCNFCGKKGHKEADCWQKPENAHKRPKNFKPNKSSENLKIWL